MNVTFVYDHIYSYPGFKATWESVLNTEEEHVTEGVWNMLMQINVNLTDSLLITDIFIACTVLYVCVIVYVC